jgi:hypothetical protein
MVENGWSPATRMFEAAGAAACQVTDAWEGIERLLRPRRRDPGGRRAGGGRPPRARGGRGAGARDRRARRAAARSPTTPTPAARAGAGRHAPRRGGGGGMKLVVFGLSLSSSWGNGHATTYRALLRAFAARGHEVVFWEWDAPWYGGEHRDLPEPDFCRLRLYPSWDAAAREALAEARDADAVLVGSYVHEGPRVIDALAGGGVEPLYFYDIDTPVTVAGLRRGGRSTCGRTRCRSSPATSPSPAVPSCSEVLEGELGAREARPLYCSVDVERYRRCPGTRTWRRAGVHGHLRARPAAGGGALPPRGGARLPERRFLLAGPQYPEDPAGRPTSATCPTCRPRATRRSTPARAGSSTPPAPTWWRRGGRPRCGSSRRPPAARR